MKFLRYLKNRLNNFRLFWHLPNQWKISTIRNEKRVQTDQNECAAHVALEEQICRRLKYTKKRERNNKAPKNRPSRGNNQTHTDGPIKIRTALGTVQKTRSILRALE